MHPKRFLALVLVLLCALLVGACGSSAQSPKASIEPGPDLVTLTTPNPCEVEPVPLAAVQCVPESAARPDGYVAARPPVERFGLIGSQIRIDTVGLRFVEGFEGFSSCPYRDTVGTGTPYTRGYGETEGITSRSPCISRAQGEANLRYRLERFYAWSIRGLGVNFNQYEADALYSFVWNLGAGIFTGSLRRSIQHHDFSAILGYDHAQGVVLLGLYRRRHAEYALAHRKPPRPHRTLNQAYTRRRVLRRELLIKGCVRRRDHRQKLGPTCKRWFAEGAQVNREIRAKGGH